ncbi:glycosyl hydrolase family 18 protein [uncultured Shewanella sp.]|uniref:glycosyl hydrolase family 18 protein n=1 Tax=uncultured Shewanella sp. TaxID=173975 RepID=UPI0026380DC7|nr:glycosyl hydrolase family 18 protein [uncultured Shewanella sp.]
MFNHFLKGAFSIFLSLYSYNLYAYTSEQISGFVLNWGDTQGAILTESPYASLTGTKNIAFVTNKDDTFYWGGSDYGVTLTSTLVDDYIATTGRDSSEFMLSFGGSTNKTDGWSYFSDSDTDSDTIITMADTLAQIASDSNLKGIDIDFEDEPDSNSTTFRINFTTFIKELSSQLKSNGQELSMDLPNIAGCSTDDSGNITNDNVVCTWAETFTNFGYMTWIFNADGDYDLTDYFDYYNVMSYSWGDVTSENAAIYTTSAVESYHDLGIDYSQLNIGLDVDESDDMANIDDAYIQSVADYVDENGLKGIFIYDYNTDSDNADTYNFSYSTLADGLVDHVSDNTSDTASE